MFITEFELFDFMRVDPAVDDPAAAFAVAAACQLVRSYTGQTLTLVRDDTVAFRGQQALLLPELPVVAVKQVTLNGVDADDWFHTTGGVVYIKDRAAYRNVWNMTVEVTYDHGWSLGEEEESGEVDADPFPMDLKLVALHLAAGTYLSGASGGMKQESLGAWSGTRADGSMGTGLLGENERRVLNRYRVER